MLCTDTKGCVHTSRTIHFTTGDHDDDDHDDDDDDNDDDDDDDDAFLNEDYITLH